jgi:hypothetical protein
MSITVMVKWGKQKFENIELDTSEPVEVFKAQLYALTSVPPERQKIMGVKGGFIKVRARHFLDTRRPSALVDRPAAACFAAQPCCAAVRTRAALTGPTIPALRRRTAPSGTTWA